MSRVGSRDTAPELVLRRALWARRLRYRVCYDGLPGRPDVVFPKVRLVVFVDGDFWHGNQWRRRGFRCQEEQFARSDSREYWLAKLRRNVDRDFACTAELVRQGWRVLRLWESQVMERTTDCIDMVVSAVSGPPLREASAQLPQRTVAEFFAGIGLVRLALEQEGWSVVFANDIDPRKHEMYSAAFPLKTPPCYSVGDIHELDVTAIPPVALATASFPCTDLSLAGARAGLAGRQSGALFGFFDVLRDMGERRPPLVLLENVPGFLSSHRGEDFRQAALALKELGYSLDAFLLDAKHFVPQSRLRLFVVGVLDAQVGDDPRKPAMEVGVSEIRPVALMRAIGGLSDVRWRLLDLPYPPRTSTRLADVLEDLPAGHPAWWAQERVEYLLGQMSGRHAAEVQRMLQLPGCHYGTVYRRVRAGRSVAELRNDGVAGCLRTPRGGSSRQILLRVGGGEIGARLMTVREYARLQGVPDDFPIRVGQNQGLFGFGDAVCVPVVRWIARYYLNTVASQLVRGAVIRSSD